LTTSSNSSKSIIENALGLFDLRHGRVQLGLVGDVALERHQAPGELLAVGQLAEARRIVVVGGVHLAAVFQQLLAHRQADIATGPGHQGDLPL
jgi:hypothetical protein